ncbi:MAG: DUF3794 domain-containing protein [Clostridia bacterium]|nr:DUF3794 domain-containing protein [Clostridia bacterium]
MDLKITKEAVCINETIYEGSVEQAIDSDVTLPDYCPDILRVLKCTIMPRINSTQTAGDRITVDGSALLRAIYVSENGRMHCYEQSIPFSKFIEKKGLESNPFVKVRIKTEYINCRAVSQRRLDIHGALSVNFMVVSKKPKEILSDAQGEGIQTKKKCIEVSSVVGSTSRAFPLTDVLEIGASKPPIAQMVRTSAFATASEIKVINNKVMIKGELIINAMYSADTTEASLETIETSLPISQVVELAGITEDCTTDIMLDLTSIDIIPKADSSGSMRLLDITARVDATLNATKIMNIPIIIDAYSTQYEIESESKIVDFKRLLESFTETNLCRSSIDVSGIGIKKVLDMWCSDITSSSHIHEEELVIRGTINVCMLVEDADNQIGYIERQINYEHKRKTIVTEKIECDPFVSVCASSFVIGAGESIDVRVEIKVQASVFAVSSSRMIDSITIDEEQGKKKTKASLTIYFSQQGESVWEIARRYNTTLEAIMQENSLTEEKVLENAMLLIPGI